MKVMQVINSFNIGGSECLAVKIGVAFRSQGIGGYLCALGENGPVSQLAAQYGIPSLCFGKPYGIKPNVMARLAWLVKTEHCDIVLTHHFRQLFHALPGALLFRKKIFHVEHDFHFYQENVSVLRKLDLLAPFTQKIICVSDEIRDCFVKSLPHRASKFLSIPNGVDTQLFRRDLQARKRARSALGIHPDTIVLGTCSRLDPIKDLQLMLHGFSQLLFCKQLKNNIALVIVGDGVQREDLKIRAKELGIYAHCYFAGAVTDVQDWLNMFDIYIITSKNEGLPLSVLEAMATELPVVAVNVGSIASIVKQDSGVLLTGRSEIELGEQLMKLVHDFERRQRLGKVARSVVEKNFSFAKMVDLYKRQMETN